MPLVWNAAKYGSGIPEIDEQHQELFARLNELENALRLKKGASEVAKILKFLDHYVVAHFACEEAHMDDRKCSACVVNQVAHSQFLVDLRALRERFKTEGATPQLANDMRIKLSDWLSAHISKIDTRLREERMC